MVADLVGSPQDRPDPGGKFAPRKRLDQIVVSTRFKPDHAIGRVATPSNDDDRNVTSASQCAQQV
jgi:hypothetical protein